MTPVRGDLKSDPGAHFPAKADQDLVRSIDRVALIDRIGTIATTPSRGATSHLGAGDGARSQRNRRHGLPGYSVIDARSVVLTLIGESAEVRTL